MKKLISVVLPCYNEEKNLVTLIPAIIASLPQEYRYEIICVDDGSSDNTRSTITQFAKDNKNIKAILMHRNFGHQAALRAGIKAAQGDAIITMDSDFQHPPKLIPKFISLWESGHDLVQGQKKSDKTASFFMKLQRKIGYSIWKTITDGVILPGVSDFRLMSKNIAKYINKNRESETFLRGVVMLSAKKPVLLPYNVGKRKHGRSSYTLKMFLNMFLNGFISFSTKPIRIASLLGIILFLISSFALLVDIATAVVAGKKIIEGWITAVSLSVLLNGIILIYLGLLGEYIGVIFKEVKRRPKYLVDKTINLKK